MKKKIKDFQKEYLPHISPIHENTKKYKRWLYSYYIILGFTLGGIIVLSNLSLLLLPIIAGTIFYRITGRYIKSIKVQLAGREKIINEYKKFLEQFETQQWQSPYLNNLQTKLKTGKTTACGAIASLGDLSQKLDYTLNLIMLFVLNYIFFWDLLMSIKIHAWFHKYAEKTTEWFEVIGRVEAIISLACLRNNHPEWIFPVIRNDNFLIVGKELGHPLIAKPQRITNDFDCPNPKIVSVVTGSNMAGKSTFLRTLGTNIILARAGAPVCAAELVLGDFRIMTYLNITDSLSENTSTFYREIKRLKKLLDSARNDNNVLLLLDELLRGTNSADKARGSMAITRDLIRHNIPAVIATHNLELADMKQQYPGNIENYYFDITIENNEHMIFDYKLKPGVCNTFNASLLLKKIGIDISQ